MTTGVLDHTRNKWEIRKDIKEQFSKLLQPKGNSLFQPQCNDQDLQACIAAAHRSNSYEKMFRLLENIDIPITQHNPEKW